MKNKVKIAIVGSRTFNDYEFLKSAVLEVLRIEDISLIISGGADGVDTQGNGEDENCLRSQYPR